MSGVVLEGEVEVGVAKRDPETFAGPSHVDQFLAVGKEGEKEGDGFGGRRLEGREKLVGAGGYEDCGEGLGILGHDGGGDGCLRACEIGRRGELFTLDFGASVK